MMRIDIISAVPELLITPFTYSIVKRAQDKKLVEIYLHHLRHYAYDKHRLIDDKPFGGGAGMLLKPEPFFRCIKKLQEEREYDEIILATPGGKIFDQKTANTLSLNKNLMFLAGHYKGIDERVREQFVTMELSIGNFVLSGGEIPIAAYVDSIVRLIPGVLHDSSSALEDSFMDIEGIAPPYYTRPAEYEGLKVPEILLTGNHGAVAEWKEQQSDLLTQRWKELNNPTE